MFTTREAGEATDDSEFRRICNIGGGEFKELMRAPGGYPDTGCQMPSGAKLFVDRSDPMTGELPTGRNSAFLTVESHDDVMTFGIREISSQGDGPQMIDVTGEDSQASFSGEDY